MGKLTEGQRAQLKALQQAYRAELPVKRDLIAGVVAALQTEGWDQARMRSLHDLIHKLTGSAAIYGLDALSRAAAELETWTLAALTAAPAEECWRQLPALLTVLDEAFAASRGPDDSPGRRGH